MKASSLRRGFALVELAIAVAIAAILSALGITNFPGFKEKAMVTAAVFDIDTISKTLQAAAPADPGGPPAGEPEFTAFCRGSGLPLPDPWGNPYRYCKLYGLTKQEVNKDKTARKRGPYKPLNHDFDLYSMGPGGQSKPALSAKVSRGDIVRADDGASIGRASAIPLEE